MFDGRHFRHQIGKREQFLRSVPPGHDYVYVHGTFAKRGDDVRNINEIVQQAVGKLVQYDDIVLTARNKILRRLPRLAGRFAVSSQIVALPREPLPHHAEIEIGESGSEQSLTGFPFAFDELDYAYAQAAAERAKDNPERGGGHVVRCARSLGERWPADGAYP